MFKLNKSLLIAALFSISAISANAETWYIDIQNYSYQPAMLTVQVGDMVEWTNQDASTHTVTSDNDIFDSGALPQFSSFSYTFNTIGDYPYHCTPHPFMTGTIYVRDSDVLAQVMNMTNPPEIQPGGGTLEFSIGLDNISTSPVNFDIWTMVTLPNGTEYGPLINGNYTVPGQTSPMRDRIQAVPASAPAGNYFYNVFVGDYPDEVWSQDFFAFQKLGSFDGNFGGMVGFPIDNSSLEFSSGGSDESSKVTVSDRITLSASPNPFNPETSISFNLPENSNVSLKVYTSSGREVAELAQGFIQAGYHEFGFNASNLSSGVYFVNLNVDGAAMTKKLTLVK